MWDVWGKFAGKRAWTLGLLDIVLGAAIAGESSRMRCDDRRRQLMAQDQ
jgi:hypothetical protein